jgi:hypothetical protein
VTISVTAEADVGDKNLTLEVDGGGLAGLDERLDRFGVSEHLDGLFEFLKEAGLLR